MELPKKKYQIIYADPAWKYQGEMMNSSVTDHYSVIDIEDLKKLPIADLADNDCVLFIWVTMPKLNEVFDVISAWGFEYKTVAFTWIKENRQSKGYFVGLGRWTRANVELCLLATKGQPKRKDEGIRQLVMSKIREHSRKPDEVYTRIERLMGNLPRVELFARNRRQGWDVWGNEAPNFTQLSLPSADGNIIADKQNPPDTDEEYYEEEYQPTTQEIHNLSGKAD